DDGANGDVGAILLGLPVRVVMTGVSGSAAVARNAGAAGFAGTFLVFVDSDVLVEPDCIQQLVQPLAEGRAEATVGSYSSDVRGLSFAMRYKQLYVARIYSRRAGYVRNDFWTAACAINGSVFAALGGFDASFRGACGEDAELGCRLSRAGGRILAVPEAIGHHRHPLSLIGLFANDWRKGLVAIANYSRSGGPISDNRHATVRDMVSVLFATILAALLLASAFVASGMVAAGAVATPVAAVFGLYTLARADIVAVFLSEGLSFAAAAFLVMVALDWLRLACVTVGTARRLFDTNCRNRTIPPYAYREMSKGLGEGAHVPYS
ncbi:MAG: glycosyltransferase, partial [Acetobacteraceae bacterium]|nr:glycosyltransferase [Acetobacteraceae bacterium]